MASVIPIILILLCVATCTAPLPLFFAVAVHEGAHLLCALALGAGKPTLRSTPSGIRLEYPFMQSRRRRLLLCLSGPTASIIFGAVFFALPRFSVFSLSLGIFNLLPVRCLDGGGVLREACDLLFLPDTSHKICRCASVISVMALWALSVAVQFKAGSNISLLAVSLILTVTVLSDNT